MNNIALFKKYIDNLDEVFALASVTSALESDASLAQQGANANEIIIPKISMDGLGDYSRSEGYAKGSVELTNETVKFNYDRGRSFVVDNMDNEETAGIAFGKLASEFLRTKVAPELDAFRFATYAGTEGIGKTEATYANGGEVLEALRMATTAMDEAEVPMEGRHLFITPTLHGMIMDLETYKSREVLSRFASVKPVPQTRFYTAIDLYDGKSGGEERGGYVKAANVMGFNVEGKIAYAPWVEASAGVTVQCSRYNKPEYWSDDEDVEPATSMFRSPNVYGYFTITTQPLKNFKIDLSGNYMGRMYVDHYAGGLLPDGSILDQDRLEHTKAFLDLGVKLSYDFKIWKTIGLQVNAGVRNILNSYQNDFDRGPSRDSGYIYGPTLPRSVFVGAKLSF